MEQMIATDIEQSKRILACGILGSTADMCWRKNKINPKMIDLIAQTPFWEEDIPAFSLSTLLSYIPDSILLVTKGYTDYNLVIYPCAYRWEIGYCHNFRKAFSDRLPKAQADSLIEACVQVIESLASRDYDFNQRNERDIPTAYLRNGCRLTFKKQTNEKDYN